MYNKDGLIKGRLYIADDVFPHPHALDSWRGIEFFSYLESFFDSKIFTSMESIGLLGIQTKEEIFELFNRRYPQYKDRVIFVNNNSEIVWSDADMAYFIFLNNVWRYIDDLENQHIPFVFELYPGGGFAMDNEESDKKLERVLSSQFFSGLIVSNIITYQYVLKKGLCKEHQVFLVQGCVLNNQSWQKHVLQKNYYGISKNTFDIAFASYRYSRYGQDKGYDIFIKIAKKLHKISDEFRFHVVGNFDSTVIDVSELGESIFFYGTQNTDWFNTFYQNIDAFISPNRPSILNKGSYDGFPTGCAIDAVIRKAVLIASDDLKQNNGQYENGKEIYITSNNADLIADRIMLLYKYPSILKSMSIKGSNKAKELYSYENQLKPRIAYLAKHLNRIKADAIQEKEDRYEQFL